MGVSRGRGWEACGSREDGDGEGLSKAASME